MGNYFIKIEDGPDVRRKLLESSKGSLHILKGYQDLLKVRSEKLSAMTQLRREMKELTVLLNRAEELMPILTDREVEELKPKKQEPITVVPKQKPEGKWVKKKGRKVFVALPPKNKDVIIPMPEAKPSEPQKMDELTRLEAALSSIENKLGKL